MYDDSSDAKKTAAEATSRGSPVRASIVLVICRWCNSLPSDGEMRVRMGPGQIAFARIPCEPKSIAVLRVRPTSACFILVYTAEDRPAKRPCIDAMLMMEPRL